MGVELSNSGTFLSALSLLEPAEDCQIIASLSSYDYHGVCSSDFTKHATFSIPTHASVTPAAIYRRTSGTNLDNLSEIAYISKRQLTGSRWQESKLLSGWYSQGNIRMKRYPIMENGWTRWVTRSLSMACTEILRRNWQCRFFRGQGYKLHHRFRKHRPILARTG
jgi:hypothetical protein